MPLLFFRVRRMAGMKETQLTADVELLASSKSDSSKQQTRPPISMNFEVCYSNTIHIQSPGH